MEKGPIAICEECCRSLSSNLSEVDWNRLRSLLEDLNEKTKKGKKKGFGKTQGLPSISPKTLSIASLFALLQERALTKGKRWRINLSENNRKILIKARQAGFNDDELLAAIDGYVRRNDFREGYLRHLTVTTVYRLSNLDANVEEGLALKEEPKKVTEEELVRKFKERMDNV